MKKLSSPTKGQIVKGLKGQVKKLQSELIAVNKASGIDEYIHVKVQKTQSRFKRVRNPKGADKVVGAYLLVLDITAKKEIVHIPISIASGKKATGFIYQIEGTAEGSISTANVTSKGDGVTQLTLGTILYAKIPMGKTATFRIQVEIRGKIGKMYTVVINRIHYKLNLRDVRYKQYLKEISSNTLRFS